MMKYLLAAGVAAVAFAATPSEARHHDRHASACAKWRHGQCVRWDNHARRHAYDVGYRFGPSYGYTTYGALPRTYVTRYRLSPRYRYVYRDNYIYQVDPATYAVMRILNAF